MFTNRYEARENRWHSRRHENRTAQDEARQRYQADHGRRARQLRALIRRQDQVTRYRFTIDEERASKAIQRDLENAIKIAETEIRILEERLSL